MLETPKDDILRTGEMLKSELDKHQDVSYGRVQKQIEELNIEFSNEVQQQIEDFCNCKEVEGV